MVQTSTDYVLDGTASEPYAVIQPIAPRVAYDRTKAAGERAVPALYPESWVVRTPWLNGAPGKNFVATMLRVVTERETLTIVADKVGQPTWPVNLAHLIVRLIATPNSHGAHHGTSSGQTTWPCFARAFRRARDGP